MYKSFPGSIRGMSPNGIEIVTDDEREEYRKTMYNKGWKPKELKFQKGIDNNYSNKAPEEFHNNFITEKLAREYLDIRANYNRPLRKDIGMDQLEVPRYGGTSGLKAPGLRNPTKLWNDTLVSPEKLLFRTFLTYANKSSHIKSNKYISKYLRGEDKYWFHKKYKKNGEIPTEYTTQDFTVRDPFHIDQFKNTTSILSEPKIINGKTTKDTKFNDLYDNRYIRGLLDYNNLKLNSPKIQTAAETAIISNDSNNMSLMSSKFIPFERKLNERKNYNEVEHMTPYDHNKMANKQLIKGNTLDKVLPSNKSTIKIGMNPFSKEIGTGIDLHKHYPHKNISSNINNKNKLNMKFHNRVISVQP
jgi:hypothetical protein